MLTKEPGWHPDPDGGRQVRFWDGEEWTEYVQPLSPPAVQAHGPDTAQTDYPYLADANAGPAREPRIVQAWTPEVVTPVGAPAGARKRRHGAGLRWWIIAGTAALVLVVIGAVTALRSSTSPVLVDPSPSSTVTASAAVSVGQSVTVDIPAQGTAVATITVTEAGSYLIEAVATQGDIAGRLVRGDQELWRGDDRGSALTELIGGVWSDPAVFVELEPGEYAFELTEHDSQATSAQVFLYDVDAVDVAVDSPATLTIPEDQYVVLRLDLDAEADLVIDVRGDGSWDDLQLTTFPGGTPLLSEDRGPQKAADLGGSEWDPYLEARFPAGVSFLVLNEYAWYGAMATVTITTAP